MRFISPENISSTALSPMPKTLIECDTISSSESWRRYGSALRMNMV